MNKKIVKKRLIAVFLIAFVIRLFLLFTPPHPDVYNHLDWGKRFWEYGAKNFYEQTIWGVSWPNQPPGSILLFALIAKLKALIFQFLWLININFSLFPSFLMPWFEKNFHLFLLKFPFALADIGMGILIYQIVKDLTRKENLAFLSSVIFLFNPALIYNSTIWGQTDSLINLLTLAGLWFLWKERFFWGLFCFFASLYLKLSLIIFTPLLVLILWQKKKFWPKWILALGVVIVIFLLVSLPFVHHGNILTWLWYLYNKKILTRQGEMLSGNAFNLWTLFFGVDLSLKENILIFGISAKFWGKLLFLMISGIVTGLAILKKRRWEFFDYLKLGVVYGFSSFLFLTNMHERYLYPIFPLLGILISSRKDFLGIFFFLSFLHLLNLYYLWWYPHWGPMVFLLSFGENVVPRLISLVNLGIFLVILKKFCYEKKLA